MTLKTINLITDDKDACFFFAIKKTNEE